MARDCWKQWPRLTPSPTGERALGRERLENEEAEKRTGKRKEEVSGRRDLIGLEKNGGRPDGYTARRDTAAGQEAGGTTPRPARTGDWQGVVGV